MKCLLKCLFVIPLGIISFLVLISLLPFIILTTISALAGCIEDSNDNWIDKIIDGLLDFWGWFRCL